MALEKIGKLNEGFNPKDLLGQTIWTQTPSGSKVQEKIIWTYIHNPIFILSIHTPNKNFLKYDFEDLWRKYSEVIRLKISIQLSKRPKHYHEK